jgi:hypothetical protein
MRTLNHRRIARLEEAALVRIVGIIAREYGLTDEETAEVLDESRQELRRWWAGLPLEMAGVTACDQERSGDDAAL